LSYFYVNSAHFDQLEFISIPTNAEINSTKFILKLFRHSSCLHRASTVSKTLFIVPTDAHYYTNHRNVKTI